MRKVYSYIVIMCLLFVNHVLFTNNAQALTLDAELIRLDNGNAAADVSFEDGGMATQTSPWIVADQYLHINFESDYQSGYWGLRIITDNINLGDDLDNDGFPDDYPIPVEDQNGNQSYGGFYYITVDGFGNVTEITDDSSRKIILAWQVYNNADPATIAQVTAPIANALDNDNDGVYEDSEDVNVSTEWYDGDWAYIGDKSNDGLEDYVVTEVIDNQGNPQTVVNYNAIAYGIDPYQFFQWLIPHPVDPNIYQLGDIEDRQIWDWDGTDANGDGYPEVMNDGWDVYLFMAGKFFNTAYSDEDGDGVVDAQEYYRLPNGDYEGVLLIELFHE